MLCFIIVASTIVKSGVMEMSIEETKYISVMICLLLYLVSRNCVVIDYCLPMCICCCTTIFSTTIFSIRDYDHCLSMQLLYLGFLDDLCKVS